MTARNHPNPDDNYYAGKFSHYGESNNRYENRNRSIDGAMGNGNYYGAHGLKNVSEI